MGAVVEFKEEKWCDKKTTCYVSAVGVRCGEDAAVPESFVPALFIWENQQLVNFQQILYATRNTML